MDKHDQDADILAEIRKEVRRIRDRLSTDLRTDPDDPGISMEQAMDAASSNVRSLTGRARHTVWRSAANDDLSRRDFLKLLGLAGVGGAAAMSVPQLLRREFPGTDTPTGRAVNLGDEGLSDGDDLANYLDRVGGGERVEVPHGTYSFSGGSISGNGWELVAPEGATLDISGGTSLSLSGSNYRFSGFVFDQQGSSDSFRLRTTGDNFQVDNLAWSGVFPGGDYAYIPSPQGDCVVERIYAGDGQEPRSGSGFTWVNADSTGAITFRCVNIQGFVDQGIYGTASKGNKSASRAQNDSPTHVESSLLKNNTISNAKVGCAGGVTRVKDTVIHVEQGQNPPCGVGCSSPGSQNTTGVKALHGTVRLENCDINIAGQPPYTELVGATVEEQNTRTGGAANIRIPDCVPESPQDIDPSATGTASGISRGSSAGSEGTGAGSGNNPC